MNYINISINAILYIENNNNSNLLTVILILNTNFKYCPKILYLNVNNRI